MDQPQKLQEDSSDIRGDTIFGMHKFELVPIKM